MQNYHNHKSYSNVFTPFNDSHVSYLDYARRARALGHRVLTCMEHGYQGNYLKLWSLAESKAFRQEFGDYPFKLVFGAEAYWVVDRHAQDDTNAHICLFARNERGRRQLTEILSIANEDGFYRVPRVDMELLHRLRPEDTLVTTACVSFWGRISRETGELVWTEHIDSLFRELHAHFGASLYLEVQAHDTVWQKQVNRRALQLSRERGVPLIVGLDSHYVTPEQARERVWMREESGIRMEDHGRGVYEDYPDDDTVRERFRQQGVLSPAQVEEAMRAADIFLTFDDLSFSKAKKLPTIDPELTQQERNRKYLDLVRAGWERYKQNVPPGEWPRYEEAIREETDAVTSTNMSDYFLIDYALVQRALAMGGVITPTGRGSGGSFFTNTLLGFSTLDRLSLPVTLYPSRFISKERLMAGSLPDLDLNVANPEIFAQAQEEVLGHGHAYPMIAYGTLRLKSAFRLFARAMGLPMSVQNTVSGQLEAYETERKNAADDEEVDVYDYVDENYRAYVEGAQAYLGVIVSKSQAPCGYLLCNGDIRSEIGLIRVNSKTTRRSVLCTVIDGAVADEYGYVKNDLLKVDVVGVNSMAMEAAGLPELTSRQIMELTRSDAPTWEIFAKGYTVGVNQCERASTRVKIMRYRPRSLTELSAFVAAIRPSFKSMVQPFLDRQHFDYGIRTLDRLLQTPEMNSSWILYQEQIMGVLGYAGFPMDQAYSVIKAIGKKHPEQVTPLKERFLERFRKRIMADEQAPEAQADQRAREVWKIIDDATGYGFNACLPGSERILSAHQGCPSLSIDELYPLYHGSDEPERRRLPKRRHSPLRNGGVAFSLFPNGAVRKNRIVDIRMAGIRLVFRLTTAQGKTIRCTANHRFPTPMGKKRLDEMRPGDYLYVIDPAQTDRPVYHLEAIRHILPEGLEMTYDVEMAGPAHNFAVASGIVTSNSHAVAVSLDALYGAYLKAHYPMAYYRVLLSLCAEKKQKDRVAAIKSEMLAAFGIRMTHCRFGEDNLDFACHPSEKTMTDALHAVKGLSRSCAEKLYAAARVRHATWIDFLLYNQEHGCAKSDQLKALIQLSYFDCFGGGKKLLRLYEAFESGPCRIYKTLSPRTIAARKEKLLEMERAWPDEDFSVLEKAAYERTWMGSPVSCFEVPGNQAMVLAVHETYSPQITLYNLRKGTTGVMKVRKPQYAEQPLREGDVIVVEDWAKRPRYAFSPAVDGKKAKPRPIPDQYDLWLTVYRKIAPSILSRLSGNTDVSGAI